MDSAAVEWTGVRHRHRAKTKGLKRTMVLLRSVDDDDNDDVSRSSTPVEWIALSVLAAAEAERRSTPNVMHAHTRTDRRIEQYVTMLSVRHT